MKNLIAKTLLIGGIAGLSLISGGCGRENIDNQEKEMAEDLKNRQVYQDFKEFIQSKTERNHGIYTIYDYPFGEDKYYLRTWDDGDTRVISNFDEEAVHQGIKNSISFSDDNSNGLDRYGNVGLFGKGVIKSISEFSPERQLELSKEYTKLIKDIMHSAEYKGY